MFYYKSHNDVVRVLAIDPGSNTCGFAVVVMDVNTGVKHIEYMHTVSATAIRKFFKDSVERYGEREAKNIQYGEVLRELLKEHEPFEVVAESAYKRFVNTFRALIEQVSVFRCVVHLHNPMMPLRLIGPSDAKKAIGVKGTSSDKELVRAALLKRDDITRAESSYLIETDEHANDAVAIALARLLIIERSVNAFKSNE